jgi:alkanesulfonate monooxygenase SsuD/methylene tetrahydromethanopterin reductase-like flavin-dependent oxidoreductase (luciferase family)
MARPLRADIPVYLAVFKPRSVELAAEIADGWLPIFFSPERARETFPAPFARGDGFDIAPAVPALISDDVESARDALRPYYALYVGGMGARGTNFYNDLVASYGFEAEAKKIQDLFLDGKQRDAAAAVPDALIDEMALVGPPDRIRDRLAAWKESGATTMLVSARDETTLRAVAEALG